MHNISNVLSLLDVKEFWNWVHLLATSLHAAEMPFLGRTGRSRDQQKRLLLSNYSYHWIKLIGAAFSISFFLCLVAWRPVGPNWGASALVHRMLSLPQTLPCGTGASRRWRELFNFAHLLGDPPKFYPLVFPIQNQCGIPPTCRCSCSFFFAILDLPSTSGHAHPMWEGGIEEVSRQFCSVNVTLKIVHAHGELALLLRPPVTPKMNEKGGEDDWFIQGRQFDLDTFLRHF